MSEAARTPTLVEWIRETCEAYPDAVAVLDRDNALTYRELWRRSSHLARRLMDRGITPEERVGLWAEQSVELMVGVLGIMAAGGVYVPLDPTYPKGRLQFMVEDANLSLLITPANLAQGAPHLDVPVLQFPMDNEQEIERPLPVISGDNAAYVIFTSGSTGRPKGVVIEHHSVIDLFRWLLRDYTLEPGDRMMATSSPSFDASIPNLILPLVFGGTVIPLPLETRRDPWALARAVADFRPRVLYASSTMLGMLTEIEWAGDPNLDLWTGGEKPSARAIRYLTPKVRSFSNFYGPTEATVRVTVGRLAPDDVDAPVGRPPEHLRCLVIGADGRPVADGEIGELYVTGSQLARGYLNDPELTAKAFVTIEIGEGEIVRAYRTGDLAKKRGDGSYLLEGRVDEQIKLRGYRIEPREIELRLMEHPAVVDAVVMPYQPPGGDEPRLVAFVIAREAINQTAVRDFLRETLPDFMVPVLFRETDQFPLSPSGKVDKRKLGELITDFDVGAFPPDGRAVPATEFERSVVTLFADVLDMNPNTISVDDDFFDLGGTSLRCMRLFMQVEETFHVELPISTLVTAPSARLLAEVIQRQVHPAMPTSTVGDASDGEWEWALCVLWSEILSVTDVGRTDDFFDLGGNDVAAERMLRQLRVINGTDASIDELRRAPTIAQFAALTQGRSTRSNVVPLNVGGTRTPFFCIAGPGGLALGFLPLARSLGPDQPFYGLQPRGIERRGFPDFTLGQAATRHVRTIRGIQPRGPYLIGGHSFGGPLALKVAHRLRQQGEEVALVAVFDSILPSRLTGVPDPRLAGGGDGDGSARRRRRRFRLPSKFSKLIQLPLVGIVPMKGIKQFQMFSLHGAIQVWYARRIEAWPGRATVYVSEGERAQFIEEAWAAMLTGSWMCVTVTGGHWGLLQRPHVDWLAAHLRDQLEEALSAVSSSGGRAEVAPAGHASVQLDGPAR